MAPSLRAQAPALTLDALTYRQREVAVLAATTHLSIKELADRLGLSPNTVKLHLHAIYQRLGVDGRVGLVLALR